MKIKNGIWTALASIYIVCVFMLLIWYWLLENNLFTLPSIGVTLLLILSQLVSICFVVYIWSSYSRLNNLLIVINPKQSKLPTTFEMVLKISGNFGLSQLHLGKHIFDVDNERNRAYLRRLRGTCFGRPHIMIVIDLFEYSSQLDAAKTLYATQFDRVLHSLGVGENDFVEVFVCHPFPQSNRPLQDYIFQSTSWPIMLDRSLPFISQVKDSFNYRTILCGSSLSEFYSYLGFIYDLKQRLPMLSGLLDSLFKYKKNCSRIFVG